MNYGLIMYQKFWKFNFFIDCDFDGSELHLFSCVKKNVCFTDSLANILVFILDREPIDADIYLSVVTVDRKSFKFVIKFFCRCTIISFRKITFMQAAMAIRHRYICTHILKESDLRYETPIASFLFKSLVD